MPAKPEPNSGKIEIGVIEAGGKVVNYRGQAIGLVGPVTKRRRCVIAHTRGRALGGLRQVAAADERVVVVGTDWKCRTRSAGRRHCRGRSGDWRGKRIGDR